MLADPIETRTTIEQLRTEYNSLGLYIFETFEEYCEDKLEDDEH